MKIDTLMDKVTVILRNDSIRCSNKSVIDTGFVAFDNKSKETGINWGTFSTCVNGERKIIEPKVIEVDNNDFEITLISEPNYSSNGGKLSFVMCLAEKGDFKFYIGINSGLMVELIRNTTFVNGKCTEKLRFIRSNGQLGVLPNRLAEKAYEWKKKIIEAPKTSKWKPGVFYKSLKTAGAYIGEITQLFKVDINDKKEYVIELQDKPKKLVLDDLYKVKYGDSFSSCINFFKKQMERKDNEDYLTRAAYDLSRFLESSYCTLPRRTETDEKINMDIAPKEFIKQLCDISIDSLNTFYDEIFFPSKDNCIDCYRHSIYNLHSIAREGKIDKDTFKLTENERQLISNILKADEKLNELRKSEQRTYRYYSIDTMKISKESLNMLKTLLEK